MKKRKREKIFIDRDSDLRMDCPNYGKEVNGKICYYICYRPSDLRRHCNRCCPEYDVEIKKDEHVYSSYSYTTQKQKFVNVFKFIQTTEDASSFLNDFDTRLQKRLNFNIRGYYDSSHDIERKELQDTIEQLKQERVELETRNQELESQLNGLNDPTRPPFLNVRNHMKCSLRGLSNSDSMLEMAETVLFPTEFSKLYNSMIIMCNSKSSIMSHFCKPGFTYSKNFLFVAEEFNSVKSLLKCLDSHLQSKKLLICHFDNNDVKIPFAIGENENYIPTTSYILFEPIIPQNVRIENLSHFKQLPRRRDLKNITKSLLELTPREKKLWKQTQVELFQLCCTKQFEKIWSFGPDSRRSREKVEIDMQRIGKDEKYFQQKFCEFIDLQRMVQIKSSEVPCRSSADFDHHVEHIKTQLSGSSIIFVGDQPVFEGQRKTEFAFPGKFHTKFNYLLGIFKLCYDLGPSQILKSEKYFNKSKSLKSIPSGYFKMSEKLFVNCFVCYWDLFSTILKDHTSLYSSSSSFDSSTYNLLINTHIPHNMVKFRGNHQFVRSLSHFCRVVLLSYYTLIKGIKTSNFDLYILSIKLFLSWCLYADKGNYFRILLLHLFDVYHCWNEDMISLFKANLTFVTSSKNHIPFDEMGEICNANTKTTTKNAKNPIKKVMNISRLNPIIGFLKHVYERNFDYSPDKVLPNMYMDLKEGWNPIKEFFEKKPANLMTVVEGMNSKNRLPKAHVILIDEWDKQK